MNIYKKWVILSLFIPLFIFMALSTLLYIYDPLMLYHKPYFRKETFSTDMRVQAKAIIDNYDFDSIIMGSSMLQNTSAKEANNKLGAKWINLSLSGSHANERFIILNYAFKKKEIKNIIYSFDAFLVDKKANTTNFEKIYNANNFFIPLGIYMDLKHPRFIRCALTYSTKEKCVGKEDLEKLTMWLDENTQYFGGFENWKKYLQSNKLKNYYLKVITQILNSKNDFNPPKNVDIEKNKVILQEYLLSFIQKNKDTNFYFIIPTYSRLIYRLNNDDDNSYYNKNFILFSKFKALLKWFIKETSKYPNVKIYGFDDLDYADNITNYKDPPHYNIDMNSMQLDTIKNNTHILTPQNMDKYFEIMEEKIRNYDLEPFKQKAKEVLDENKP